MVLTKQSRTREISGHVSCQHGTREHTAQASHRSQQQGQSLCAEERRHCQLPPNSPEKQSRKRNGQNDQKISGLTNLFKHPAPPWSDSSHPSTQLRQADPKRIPHESTAWIPAWMVPTPSQSHPQGGANTAHSLKPGLHATALNTGKHPIAHAKASRSPAETSKRRSDPGEKHEKPAGERKPL
jgi:hypothetical protein